MNSLNIIIVLLIFLTVTACNENPGKTKQIIIPADTITSGNKLNETSQSESDKATLDKNKIPKEVINGFSLEYPVTNYESWYGYPDFDTTYWFNYDPLLRKHDYPENYVVEFKQDNIPYRAIYSKSGKKMATYKKLNTDLPKAVSAAINKSQYKTWILSNDKEEIFKDKDSDQIKVFKVTVTKGNEMHMLFYQNNGKLLKDKKIS